MSSVAGQMRVFALAFLLVAVTCGGPRIPSYERPPSGYELVSPGAARDEIARAVEEYYAVRARAIAAWDATILYMRYPALATGEDRARQVNIDGWFIERMRAQRVRTVTTKIEDREPMRVYVKGNDAAVFVHGRFDWIESGTAGEFLSWISLVRDSTWNVVRVDEVSDAELHAP